MGPCERQKPPLAIEMLRRVCVCVCARYHLRQLDVGEAADERLAEASQLLEEAVVVLLHHLVLLFDALQVALHRRDLLSGRKKKTTTAAEPSSSKDVRFSFLHKGVDAYLRLQLLHVRLHLHVGFIQLLNVLLQMLTVLFAFNAYKWHILIGEYILKKQNSRFPAMMIASNQFQLQHFNHILICCQ